MKYLSLFSGIGGFELGLEQSEYEFENVGFSEIDKYAKSIYIRHFPRHKDLGDASEIDPSEIEDFDLLVGGFPCQAFSLSGKRKGFDDTRGTLFFEIARICEAKRPRYLLLENVKGLLSHDGGRTFKKMLGVLSELGYDVEWQVLNSKSFGVAQNRERVYIKGYSRAKCGREILSQERDSRKTGSELDNGIQTLYDGRQSSKIYGVDGCSPTLCGNGGGMGAKTGLYKIQKVGNLSNTNHNGKNVYSKDGISPALCSGSVPKNGLNILELPDDRKLKSVKFNRQVRKRVHDADYDELSEFLRQHKKAADITLKSISKDLGVKHSEVEHWFRTDEYFCPPPPEVWDDLKRILDIRDDRFDAFITEFELVDGVYEMDKRAYDEDGLSPTLTTKGEALAKINVVGNVSASEHWRGKVLDDDGISRSLTANDYKDGVKVLEKEPKINVIGNTSQVNHWGDDVFDTNGISRSITASNHKHPLKVLEEKPEVEKVYNTTRKFNKTDTDGTYTPCLTQSMGTGGGNVPMLKLKTNTKKGYDEVTTGDGVRLCHPSSTKARGRTQKGQTGALSTQADWGTVDRDYRIRRLTPLECERLQAFPTREDRIEIWLSDQARRNVQYVVERCRREQRLVGNVEKDKSLENVLSVERNLHPNDPQTEKPALQNVQINFVGKQIQLFNLKKLNSSAETVERKNGYLLHIVQENFAHLIVGMNTILEKIIVDGKGESLLKEKCSTHQENGKKVVKLFGEEIMPLVNSVEEDSTIMNRLMKFITSDLSNIKSQDVMLTTLYCYVIGVIIGSIPIKTDISCLEKIELNVTTGWTEYGKNGESISDTQRYKCLGNAVTTTVITWIANTMFGGYFESQGTDN